jgi:hypothetical protein
LGPVLYVNVFIVGITAWSISYSIPLGVERNTLAYRTESFVTKIEFYDFDFRTESLSFSIPLKTKYCFSQPRFMVSHIFYHSFTSILPLSLNSLTTFYHSFATHFCNSFYHIFITHLPTLLLLSFTTLTPLIYDFFTTLLPLSFTILVPTFLPHSFTSF